MLFLPNNGMPPATPMDLPEKWTGPQSDLKCPCNGSYVLRVNIDHNIYWTLVSILDIHFVEPL